MLRPIAIETTQKIKAALSLARARISGASAGVGLAALLVFIGFVLMAILAPIALQLPSFLQSFLGFLPFLALMAGIFIAVSVLIKLGKSQNAVSTEGEFAGTIAKAAYHEAMNFTEDCGLKSKTARDYTNCFSGQINDIKIAIFVVNDETYALLRLKSALDCFIIIAPKGEKWPFEYKAKGKLAPINVGREIGAMAWSFESLEAREKAQQFVLVLEPALKMSKIGGQTPFLWGEGRDIALKWKTNDIGACALIANEIANAIKN